MKKIMCALMVVTMTFMLAACGAQKNDLDAGYALIKKGDCAGAEMYLDSTIAAPDHLMDLAYAYFLKGQCAEKVGDAATAYENFYASKVVTCYAVSEEIHVNLNTYGRSEFCERIIPARLAKLEPEVGDKAKIEAIVDKVDGILTTRYLQRFQKRLN
nr:hypothetical protein [uncultured Pseudodesulfovibrio sp.]